MSLYCVPCSQHAGQLQLVPAGQSNCGRCGGYSLACVTCRRAVAPGACACTCGERALASTRELRPPPLPSLSTVLPVVNVIPEVYGGGGHGVEAEVFLPPGDAAILNELLAMVGMLHAVASRITQLAGMSDHTRQVVRDMRNLATLCQEELEMRAGTRGS